MVGAVCVMPGGCPRCGACVCASRHYHQVCAGPWVWGKIKKSDHKAFAWCQRMRAQEIQRRVSQADIVYRNRRRSSIQAQLAESVAKLEQQVCACDRVLRSTA